jgi:hypothetical protein
MAGPLEGQLRHGDGAIVVGNHHHDEVGIGGALALGPATHAHADAHRSWPPWATAGVPALAWARGLSETRAAVARASQGQGLSPGRPRR